MNFNQTDVVVLCVVAPAYIYGLFAVITGRGGGVRARIGGIGALGLASLLVLAAYYPERKNAMILTMAVWAIALLAAGYIWGRGAEPAAFWPSKRKRKNDE